MIQISIHAPRAGGDDSPACSTALTHNFNPRSPCGERPKQETGGLPESMISIHAPRAGSDVKGDTRFVPLIISIHAPRAGSDIAFRIGSRILVVISIHAPRAGSDEKLTGNGNAFVAISIHAPRAGSDSSERSICTVSLYFNPRSPCGERRAELSKAIREELFQSTLPVRGATAGGYSSRRLRQFQSTLPVRGATLSSPRHQEPLLISIHAPRAGSDSHIFSPHFGQSIFQSTLPVRGATKLYLRRWISDNISIHAPRAGSDVLSKIIKIKDSTFQSTLPVRGATIQTEKSGTLGTDFNPRSPCGERRSGCDTVRRRRNFNPRSPCGERLRCCTIPA